MKKKGLSLVLAFGMLMTASGLTAVQASENTGLLYHNDYEDFVKYDYSYGSTPICNFDGAGLVWTKAETRHGNIKRTSGAGFAMETADLGEVLTSGKVVISSQVRYNVEDTTEVAKTSFRYFIGTDTSSQSNPYASGAKELLTTFMSDGSQQSGATLPTNIMKLNTTVGDYYGRILPNEWTQLDLLMDLDNQKATLYVNGREDAAIKNVDIIDGYKSFNRAMIVANHSSYTCDIDNFKVYTKDETAFEAVQAFVEDDAAYVQMSSAVASLPETAELKDLATGDTTAVEISAAEGSYIKISSKNVEKGKNYVLTFAEDEEVTDILGRALDKVYFGTNKETVLTDEDFADFGTDWDAANLPGGGSGWLAAYYGGGKISAGSLTGTDGGYLKYDTSVSGYANGTSVFYTFPQMMPKNYNMQISFDAKISKIGADADTFNMGVSFAVPSHAVNKKIGLVSMNTIRSYRVGADQKCDMTYWYGKSDTAATLVDSASYSADAWYKIIVDLAVTDNYSISAAYTVLDMDGNVLGKTDYIKVAGYGESYNLPAQYPTGLYFNMTTSGGRSQSYIDNFKVSYTEEADISALNIVSLDGSENAADTVISNAVKGFALDYNTAPEAAPTVVISDGTNEITNTVSGEGTAYNVSLNEVLLPNTDYTMTVTYTTSENKTWDASAAVTKTYTYKFKTEDVTELVISDIGFYNGETKIEDFASVPVGSEITLKAEVYNFTGKTKTACLLYGVYSGGRLEAIDYVQNNEIASSFEPVEIEKSLTVTSDMNADSLKGFIWESLTSYKPYTTSIELKSNTNA